MKGKNYKRMINSVRWARLRREKLTACPFCERCETPTPAREVHHVVPVESVSSPDDMERLMFDYKNLQSLCHSCHVQAHVELKSKSKATNKERVKREIEDFENRFFGGGGTE